MVKPGIAKPFPVVIVIVRIGPLDVVTRAISQRRGIGKMNGVADILRFNRKADACQDENCEVGIISTGCRLQDCARWLSLVTNPKVETN